MSCLEPTAVKTMTSPALADEFADLILVNVSMTPSSLVESAEGCAEDPFSTYG